MTVTFRSLWLAVLLAGLPVLAPAMDIATYDKQRKEAANSPTQTRLRVYLLGIGEGLRLANQALLQREQAPLFCAPDGPPMMGDDYRKLIDAALSEARGTLERQELSVEAILLRSLREKYPCTPPAPAPSPAAAPAAPTS
jgi:hypothetical protein